MTTHREIIIAGRPVRITLSSTADKLLQQYTTPLVAEMELYFSCLVGKKVRFDELEQAGTHANEHI